MLYTYFDYLEKIEQVQDEFDQPLIKNIIHHIDALQPYSFLGLPVVYLLDYRARSFIFYSHNIKNMAGYHYRDFIDGGLSFPFEMINKADMKVYTDVIFKENMKFLGGIPHAEHSKYIFSTNYRGKTKNGENIMLKQSNIFLQSTSDGLPLYTMGTVINITAIKNDLLINHQIEKDNGAGNYPQNKMLVTNYLYPEDAKPKLSKREVEVVKLAASGLSSKQIADKMHISINTINRHRSNILLKTNCKNVAELISYALKERLL